MLRLNFMKDEDDSCRNKIISDYTSAHGSGQRYSVLLLKFLSFFFLFLSPKDLRDGATNREPFLLRRSDIGVILKIGSKIWGATPH